MTGKLTRKTSHVDPEEIIRQRHELACLGMSLACQLECPTNKNRPSIGGPRMVLVKTSDLIDDFTFETHLPAEKRKVDESGSYVPGISWGYKEIVI